MREVTVVTVFVLVAVEKDSLSATCPYAKVLLVVVGKSAPDRLISFSQPILPASPTVSAPGGAAEGVEEAVMKAAGMEMELKAPAPPKPVIAG